MININNEVWNIMEVPPGHPMLQRSDGSYSEGVCDDKRKTIFINGQLNNRMFKKVLCHELTHAAIFSYNVDLSIEEEEVLADIIATYGEEIISITNSLFERLRKERYY